MADVGGIINRLAPLIEKKVRNEYNLWINSKSEARKLYFNLKEIQKVSEEAERRRLVDPRVRAWLESLQDVTYEIDDVLDEWETLHLQLQIEGSNDDDVSHTWLEKVSIFVESLCLCFRHVFRHRDMTFKIKELNKKIDSLGKETAKYTLLPITSDSEDVKFEITTSFSGLIELHGQQIYKEELVKALLTLESGKPDGALVISLVGMVGIGKTTVAQLAFNDLRVHASFELKSWICVFHISDMIQLTKAILQSFRVSYHEDAELQMLLELIGWSVFGKKFLLVLDHVRIEDDSMWNQLKASLKYGAPGSRIVVTSRNENVLNLMDSTQIMEVPLLNEDDCWLLFSGIALRRRSLEDKEKLGGIGQRITKKCGGLPLAAKTLGYYLQSRGSKELWEDALEKEVWQLDEVAKALFAPLASCYNELPLALKHCFSYCAFYPKDVWINVDELIRLWMVQGYLSSSVADTEMELKGREYFEILARRYFFQDTRMDDLGEKIKRCKMHPILLNFARYLAKTKSKAQGLRSFYSKHKDCLLPIKPGSLKSVRVLLVTESKTHDLPKDIGKSIHLRYINLAYNPIKQLPVTICDLYNLYCLDLRYCLQLSKLPEQIHKLKNLRHLLVGRSGIKQLPRGLGKLTDLQTLDVFYVGKGASKFGYLDKLNKLQGSMYVYILDLKEKKDVEDAKKADFSRKIYISDLRLIFQGEVSIDVLDHLQVPPNMRQFHVSSYRGTQFPSWISTSLRRLIVLELEACAECLELPPIGKLPFLEILRVTRMVSLERISNEFWVGLPGQVIFPRLRRLEFRHCASWKEWEDITEDAANTLSIMPLLETLTFRGCPELKALPDLILHKATYFQSLEIGQDCPHLSRRYQPNSSEWEFIFQN